MGGRTRGGHASPAGARSAQLIASTNTTMVRGIPVRSSSSRDWVHGHAAPEAVVQGYAAGARGLGAQLATHCELLDIEVEADEIRAVRTSRGVVKTSAVICAAGAWSRAIAESIGASLPVTPLRRQVLFAEPIPDLPRKLPMTIDFATSFYFHREGPGVLMGMSWPGERPGFHLETTDDWIPACWRSPSAGHRVWP